MYMFFSGKSALSESGRFSGSFYACLESPRWWMAEELAESETTAGLTEMRRLIRLDRLFPGRCFEGRFDCGLIETI